MTANQQGGADDPFIGRVLDGKYRIDKMLGQGGMGAVYQATHVLMDHPCAVKVLHSSMMADPSAIPRFQREARAAVRIRHQNAIAVNDFGITSDNVVYLVMEFFPGRSLREILREDGRLSVERTTKIIERVAAALDAAHQEGIIHRDVKPDNIMLRPLPNGDDDVKVLDFGIAKIVDQHAGNENLTITGTIIGTPYYLSPEQCRAVSDLDSRSDTYSLAVVTYEMLTGSVPFMAATPIAVAMMHISDPPPSLVDKVPGFPPGAEAVVHRALSKRREDRYPTAVEYAQDLYTAIFGQLPASGETRTGALPPNTPRPFDTGQSKGVDTGSYRTGSTRGTQQTMIMRPGVDTPRTAGTVPPPQNLATGQTTRTFHTPSGFQTAGDERAVGTDTPKTSVYAPEAAPPAPNRMLLYAAVVALVVAAGAIAYFAMQTRTTPEPPPVVVDPTPPPPKADPTTPPPGMVYVPGGTYDMGRETDDPYEGPPHPVTVAPFFIDKTEVTNRQYAEFIQATGYQAPPDWENNTYKVGTADFPVVNVSWNDARAYAEWAKKRLPTEAEWEFAARGKDGRVYPWGNEWIPNAAYTKESRLSSLQPAGSAPAGASPFGVLDMSGSVWEWCSDNFAPYPGSRGEAKDPTFKIIRGGSIGEERDKTTATYRNWVPPEDRYPGLGFRCVRSVE